MPRGVPAGGQFTATRKAEAEVTLGTATSASVLTGRVGDAFARNQADGHAGWALVNRTLADVGVHNVNDDPVTAGMVARAAGFDIDWGTTAVEDSQGDTCTITPGVLDDEAKALYEDGPQSLALAAAIAREKDWDVLLTYATGETRIFDAQAMAPAAAGAPLVTVNGLCEVYNSGGSEWVDETRYDVEIIPRPSRSDLINHLVADWTDAPVHGPLAQTFVSPVLAQAAQEREEREEQVRAYIAAARPGHRLYDETFRPFTVGGRPDVRHYDIGDDGPSEHDLNEAWGV
ncbi:hypothetical protein GCM10027273_08980 [Nocardioides pakistanensis]